MKKFLVILFIFYSVSFSICAHADDTPSVTPVNSVPIVEEILTLDEIVPEEDFTPLPTVTFIIRSGDTVLYNGDISIPEESMVEITDNEDTVHHISSRSVLALLATLDALHDEFSITNLAYYSSFSSFYLKCLVPSEGTELCDNWQYAVGSTTPFTSIDTTLLSGGEIIGLYFGFPHRVSLSSTSVTAGNSFIATAESYNYANNTWNVLTGVTIGVTIPNPVDPWTPTVVTKQTVDEDGKAIITLFDTGSYSLGISEDFYFPLYALTVTEPIVGGGGGSASSQTFSIDRALSYLYSVQSHDGSFGDDLYTDWAGIAYAASSNTSQNAKTALLEYISSHAQTSLLLTDNERMAITLLSLGENPYTFGGTNYISPIVSSFDGTQFGDSSLVNDDIFALLPLSASGYSASDDMVAKDIKFLVSKQRSDGSWEGSIDLTASAIQAFQALDVASEAVAKAIEYLRNNQKTDGGFGSVYSTSWAMQAGATWGINGKTGADYLASMQAPDGGVLSQTESVNNRVWATSYAIPAVLGKPWSVIMHAVSKPQTIQITSSFVIQTEEPKKGEKTIEQVNKPKPDKVPMEIIPKMTQEAPVVLIIEGEPQTSLGSSTLKNPETVTKEKMLELATLTAVAGESKADIPTPIVVGSFFGIGVLVFITRKIFLKF